MWVTSLFRVARVRYAFRAIVLVVLIAVMMASWGGAQVPAQSSAGTDAAAGSPAQEQPLAPAAQQAGSVQPAEPKPHIHVLRIPDPAAPTAAPLAALGAHVTYFGGPVITNVHIVQVLYGTGAYLSNVSSTAAPSVATFYTDLTQSPFFDMLNEYSTAGVTASDGTPGTSQTIGHGFFDGQFTINPSLANNGSVISDAQIQTELLNQVAAGNLPSPVFDTQGNNNTLYMIFFPPGKTISLGNISSCVKGGFCAYHNSTTGTFASHRLYYGVHPDMQPPSACASGCGAVLPFDVVTNVTSHELAEAVSDADVGPASAFARPLAWVDPVNGEIADICQPLSSTVPLPSGGYLVSKQFSNFQNDCVVAPGLLFFNPPNSTVAGQQFDLDVTAQSEGNNNITGYTGTVHFSSTDAAAVLPPDYTYNSADAGLHTFIVTLKTPGSQTITATDTKGSLLPRAVPVAVIAQNSASTLAVALPGFAVPGVAIPVTVMAKNSFPDFSLATGYNGTVHFTSSDAAAVLPADTPLTNGIGTFSVTFNTAGATGTSQTLFVKDASNAQIFGSGFSFVSSPAATPTATLLSASSTSPLFGQSLTLSAAVTQGGSPVNVGFVNFTADGASVGSLAVDATGHAQTPVNLGGGPHVLFADYSFDPTHPPSSSAPLSLTVAPTPTTLVLSTQSSPSTFGQRVFLIASLSSALNGVSGGAVTFFDGGVPLAVIPATFSSVSFGDTSLSVGSHTITASYSGNANFGPSASTAPVVQVVNPAPPADYSISSSRNTATISAGQSASFNITTQSLNGFAGNVTFSCGALPAFSSCTFTPAQASVNGTVTSANTTLIIKTTGPHALLLTPNRQHRLNAFNLGFGAFALAAVLLAGVDRRKRRRAIPLVMLALMLLMGIVSCGGGGTPQTQQPPVTPPGTSSITVTATGVATSGSKPANPTQQMTISITVLQ